MAFLDERGTWRCVASRKELRGITQVEWPEKLRVERKD
jgi:hypothetical protein